MEGGVELLENGEGGWYDEDGTRWFYHDVQPELHRYTVTFTASGTEGFGIISDELRITLYDAQGRPIPGVQGAYGRRDSWARRRWCWRAAATSTARRIRAARTSLWKIGQNMLGMCMVPLGRCGRLVHQRPSLFCRHPEWYPSPVKTSYRRRPGKPRPSSRIDPTRHTYTTFL